MDPALTTEPRRRRDWRRCSAASTRTSCARSPTATARSSSSPAPGPARPRSSPGGSPGSSRRRRARPSEILALTFTDKAADEMAVRVDQLVPYGYTDSRDRHVPRLRRPADPRVRPRARAAAGRAGPVAGGGRHLPARAPVRVRPRRYRPLGDPTRFLAALATLFSRCKDEDIRPTRTSRTPSGCAAEAAAVEAARRCRREPTDARPRRGRAAARASWPAPTRRTSGCWPRTAASTSATRSRSPCASCGPRRPCAPRSPARFRYVLVDEFQDTNRCQAELVALLADGPPQRDRRRRRRPGDLRLPRRGGRQHPRLPATAIRAPGRRPAPELPIARADPRRAPTGSSGATTRIASRSGRGSSSGCGRSRQDRAAAPVRRRGLRDRRPTRPTGSPPTSRRRIAAGARPRDHAVLVRANSHADPVLRALNVAGHPVAVLRRRRGCTPGPRSGCCSRSCAPIADPDSSVDVYALAASEVYGLGGEDLTAIVNMRPPPQPHPSGRSSTSSTRSPASCASRRRAAPARRTDSSSTCAGYLELGPRAAGRRGPLRVPARQRAARPAGRRDDARRPRKALANVARFFDIVRAQIRAAGRRPGGVRGAPSADAHRGRRRPGDAPSSIPDADARRRPDGPQGQGPRVPGRVPAGPRRRSLPGRRSRRTAGAAGRARSAASRRRASAPWPRSAACSTSR